MVWHMPNVARNRVASMGMIGYTTSLAKKHKWSEGIAPLEKREDIIGHLISKNEQRVATPK